MKRALLICFVCLCLLCGCENNKNISKWIYCGEIEKSGENLSVYYDENTKIMYACYGSGISVLLNADGTPILWGGDN